VVWGLITVMAVAAAWEFRDFLPFMPPCLFRIITGIPCLTCGGTHCVAALSRFDFGASFLYNPLIMITLIILILFSLTIFMGIIFHRRTIISLSPPEKRGLRITIILLAVANWAYLIVKMT
jgi:hypothetical protein